MSGSIDQGQTIDETARPQASRGASSMTALEDGVSGKKLSKAKAIEEATNRRNDELNILLVIVGLLAATITSFVLYIQPQLQQDSGDESVALLRVLLYNMNQTIFGSDSAPTLPVWPGAPAILTVAQIILYACLAATLLCGLYAMLIKFLTDSNALNWKNRVVDWFTRWVFFVIYLLLSGVFFWLFVALTLQVPFLPSTSTLHFVKKLGA